VPLVPPDPDMEVISVTVLNVGKAAICRNRLSSFGNLSNTVLQLGSTLEVANNLLVSDNLNLQIQSWIDGSTPLSFVHNNVFITKGAGILVFDQAAQAGLQVFSNIIESQLYGIICFAPINADYNNISARLSHYGLSPGPHDLAVDPQFVDEVDYRLQPSSPCIDAGIEDPDFNDVIPPGQGTLRNDMGGYGGPWAGTIPDAQPEAIQQESRASMVRSGAGATSLAQISSLSDPKAAIETLRQDLGRKTQESRKIKQRLESEYRTATESGTRRAGGAL